MVGVNHFSDINDIYGYDTGNVILKTIAADFLDAVHYQGSVYRMDGVRFAFYFENKDKEWITEFYDELKQNIKKQQILNEKPIAITFSAGAVILNDNAGIHSVPMHFPCQSMTDMGSLYSLIQIQWIMADVIWNY